MQKRRTLLTLAAVCMLALGGCTASAEEWTGEAVGYGGPVKVSVTLSGGKITMVRVLSHSETEGIGTRAIGQLPDAIARAGSVEVDDISGATLTSQAIKAAVSQAVADAGAAQGAERASEEPETTTGIGLCATGRIGPRKDEKGNPLRTMNIVAAGVTFDAQGRIVQLRIDQLEAPVPGAAEDAAFFAEVEQWKTKGMLGTGYMVSSGSWRQEMDAYERLFVGRTVGEVEKWFRTYCSEETGRPLSEGEGSQADQTRYEALTQAERDMLADVTSSATISLRDEHGDIITAILRAWEDASGRK